MDNYRHIQHGSPGKKFPSLLPLRARISRSSHTTSIKKSYWR